ncbi:MAG: hypothetical protein ACI4SQ_06220, partial [Eubacterium sp.]
PTPTESPIETIIPHPTPTGNPIETIIPHPTPTENPIETIIPHPTPTENPIGTIIPHPTPTESPIETKGPKVSEKPGATAKPKMTQAPIIVAKPTAEASIRTELKKDKVVSVPEVKKQETMSLFGAKSEKGVPGKVKFKKITYKKKKICITWKKVKKAQGYQVVFLKRKKGRTRMCKYTKKTKFILPWNGIGKCFVKMRAFQNHGKKRVYGSWSACKRVKSN